MYNITGRDWQGPPLSGRYCRHDRGSGVRHYRLGCVLMGKGGRAQSMKSYNKTTRRRRRRRVTPVRDDDDRPRAVTFGAVGDVLSTDCAKCDGGTGCGARERAQRRRRRRRSCIYILSGGGTNVHDDCAEDHSIRMYRRPPGIKPVSSRWSHGLVRGLPPKPRRVVKAPARHNRRRGLSTRPTHTPTLYAQGTTHTHSHKRAVHTSSHLHLAAAMTVVDTL